MTIALSEASFVASYEVNFGSNPDVFFRPDGVGVFVLDDGASKNITEYQCTSAFNYDGIAGLVSSNKLDIFVDYPSAISFSDDGLSLFVYSQSDQKLYLYTGTSAWDLSTFTKTTNDYDGSTNMQGGSNLSVGSDGTHIGIKTTNGYSTFSVTSGDLSTCTLIGTYSIENFTTGSPYPDGWNAMQCLSDGSGIMLGHGSPDIRGIWVWGMSTLWDISTASESYNSDGNIQEPYIISKIALRQNGDGSYDLIIYDTGNYKVHVYTIPTLVTYIGIVQESGVGVARTIRAHIRSTGAVQQEVTSSAVDGSFTLDSLIKDIEYYLIVLDDDSGTQYNLKGYDRIVGL